MGITLIDTPMEKPELFIADSSSSLNNSVNNFLLYTEAFALKDITTRDDDHSDKSTNYVLSKLPSADLKKTQSPGP